MAEAASQAGQCEGGVHQHLRRARGAIGVKEDVHGQQTNEATNPESPGGRLVEGNSDGPKGWAPDVYHRGIKLKWFLS